MKLNLVGILSAFIVSQNVLAAVPQSCPTVYDLNSVGVSTAVDDFRHHRNFWFGVKLKAMFATPDEWTFMAGPVVASSEADAITSVNNKILSLTLSGGPRLIAYSGDTYICSYSNQDKDFFGIAITPVYQARTGLNYYASIAK